MFKGIVMDYDRSMFRKDFGKCLEGYARRDIILAKEITERLSSWLRSNCSSYMRRMKSINGEVADELRYNIMNSYLIGQFLDSSAKRGNGIQDFLFELSHQDDSRKFMEVFTGRKPQV